MADTKVGGYNTSSVLDFSPPFVMLQEEELCKAATFVMQCCLLEDNPKGIKLKKKNIKFSEMRYKKI